MKICIISDTHTQHHKLNIPESDIIIHAGDISDRGTDKEVIRFMEWFSNLNQVKYKVVIAGNHDRLFEIAGEYVKSLIPQNVVYLENSSIEIMGLKFYGTPVSKRCDNWAFQYTHEEKLVPFWKAIPTGVDILITHCPPYKILDKANSNEYGGSISLYEEVINRIHPKLHVFGHLHLGYGKEERDGITYVNASLVDEHNVLVKCPILIEFPS